MSLPVSRLLPKPPLLGVTIPACEGTAGTPLATDAEARAGHTAVGGCSRPGGAVPPSRPAGLVPGGPVPWFPPSPLTRAAEQCQEQRQERDGAGAHVRLRPLPGSQRRVRAAAAAGNRLPSEEGPRRRKCRWRRWGRAGGAGGAERMDPPPPEAPCLSFPTAPCGAAPLEGRTGSAPGRGRALVPGVGAPRAAQGWH